MKQNLRLFLVAIVLIASSVVHAQYYMASSLSPGNPGGINTDSDVYFATLAPPSGSNVLINYPFASKYSVQYSAVQTVPFTFNFNGSTVTSYKVSTSGYVTFSTSSVTPVGASNTALPSALLPDNSICVWGLAGASNGGKIYTKVYGSAPNRQLWIVYWFAGNPGDSNSQNVWSVVLEETTNNIYIVDMWGNISAPYSYNPLDLTVGVQVNSTTAYQVALSPNVQSITWSAGNSDNIYYEFSPSSTAAYTPQPKKPLIEEFMQASCPACYEFAPELDSVLANNGNNYTCIRYHVWWPGVDYMDSVTYAPFVYDREGYYPITYAPTVELDGNSSNVSPVTGEYIFGSMVVQNEEAIGSPFTIDITSALYDTAANTYSASASIKAFHTFASGLVVQAVLTVDTMEYANCQSSNQPGNTSTYYLNFPQVAEDMMPSYIGTKLGAFAMNQTQTVNVSWKKDHPWGSSPTSYIGTYDSTNTHITFFIQDNSTRYVYQSASAAFNEPITTGINAVENDPYFELYPNPTNSSFKIAYNISQAGNVSIDMYTILGENVYSSKQTNAAAGEHSVTVDRDKLSAGIYLVRFIAGNSTITKKLVIE